MKESNNWPEDIISGICNGKHYKGMLNECIGRMSRKKLYKYYSFDSIYTLDNIENDVIYLSNPVSFNDPLDCNIGISANFIIRLILPQVLKTSGIDMGDEAYKLLISLLFDEEDSNLQENSKEAIITECMKYPQFASLIKQQNDGKPISDDQMMDLIIECPDVASKLIQASYSNQLSSCGEIDSEKITQFILSSPRALKNVLGSVFDVKPDEKRILDVFSKEEDVLQKIVDIAEYVDPSIDKSKIEEFYMNLDTLLKNIHTSVGSMFGVSCFTESPQNMLMWSHYANKHSGICVEYDFGKLFSGNQDLLLFPVNYSRKRPLLPLEKVVAFNDDNLTFAEDKISIFIPDVMKALSAKSDVWQYEKEWRLIKNVKDEENRKIRLPLISGIYAGVNISEENLLSISSLAKQKDVPIYQCAMKNDRYQIVIKQGLDL